MNHLLPALLCALPLTLHAAVTEISNDSLTVRFDDAAHSFSISDKGANKPFVNQAKPSAASTAVSRKPTSDPLYGKGESIRITLADGGITSLELYQKLPFLLVRSSRTNQTTAEIDLQKIVPVTFAIDLGQPASALTTMGTGGLLRADKNPGSYLVLACADPTTRNGVVAGFISQFHGSGVVIPTVNQDTIELKAQLEHGHLILPQGKSTTFDTFAIGHFTDSRIGLETFADIVATTHHIKLRPKSAVYCSWYAEGPNHGRAGTPETTLELARFINTRKLKDYGLSVIQLDDGWQDGPNIQGPATEFDRVSPKLHYKDGIAPVAKEVEAAGLTFGLWWLPFGRNHMQPEYQDKQDWFFKWPDGKPLRQKGFGGSCLDSTHPAVQAHLESLAKSIRSWGVKYYKMDGLSVGAGVDHVYINDAYKADRFGESQPPHDRTKTQIEAMRLGLQTIRKGAGNDVFFSGCCAVQNMRIYAGSIGLVDSMRVGPDFNHDGQGIRSGPLRGSWVYFLNGKVWWNDPDPTKVRISNENCIGDSSIKGGVTLEQAHLTSSWVSLTNQFYLISDWLPSLPEERLDILKKTMAAHHATTRPVDYFDHNLANTWLVTDQHSGVRRDVIGLFNFYDKPLEINHTLLKLGLDPNKTYHAYDFWANQPLPDINGSYQDSLPANSCRVVSLRESCGHPVVISTSRHVTQGIIDINSEKWAHNTLTGTSEVIANDPYELRVRMPAGWTLDQANATWSGPSAGKNTVTCTATTTPGMARITINSTSNGPVSWKITFKATSKPSSVSINQLKAEQSSPADPVILTWHGSEPFYQISRDGTVIAAGHYGESYQDQNPPTAKSVTYTIQPIGGPDHTSATASVTLTTKTFTPTDTPPKPDVSLTTLTPTSSHIGFGNLNKGKSINGGPLTLSAKTYQDGISIHAASEVVYSCKPEWKRFVATVGLDDSQRSDPRASIICSVTATDASGKSTTLTKTPVLASGKIADWNLNVAIPPQTKTIHLVVGDAGDGINCDHSDWVNAGFLNQ